LILWICRKKNLKIKIRLGILRKKEMLKRRKMIKRGRRPRMLLYQRRKEIKLKTKMKLRH